MEAHKSIFVTEEKLININPDDPFFDSFQAQYINFKSWFQFLAGKGKSAWVYIDSEKIKAFLLMEEENGRLNISKINILVHESVVGELFIKIAIDEAIKRGIEEIYFSCFSGMLEKIIPVFMEFGFTKSAKKTNSEDVYVKRIVPPHDSPPESINFSEIIDKYYPAFYDGIKVKKYLLPVLPAMHKQLFADSPEYKPTLFEAAGEKFIEGNTIRKKIMIKPENELLPGRGDILLIYRAADIKAITGIGIVESTGALLDGKLLINFKWHFHLPVYIESQFLVANKISTGNISKITRIDQRKYKLIIAESKLNNAFIIR